MKEIDSKEIEHWYERLLDIASKRDVNKRYENLERLHGETLEFYTGAIRSITKEDVSKQSSDGRLVSVVVAHIMVWEEWQIQVFTDPNKDERLRQQMRLQSYYDPEKGKMVDFRSVDGFNAYQSKKYTSWRWGSLQRKTIYTASQLKSIFPPNPPSTWIDFLESTPFHNWKILPNNILSIPAGWYLWMVSLEHEAITHRKDIIK